MCDDYTPYHPHHTYTFESSQPPFITNKIPSIRNIQELKLNRPMLANGVMKLYKEDIKTNYFGCKKYLKVEHPYILGKSGFVVFSFHDIPDSQDTKTTFSAFVILGQTGVCNCDAILKTCKVPFVMYLRPDGFLSEYSGPVNAEYFKKQIGSELPFC